MQVACDSNRLSLEDQEVKYSNRIEDHESEDDSLLSRGLMANKNQYDIKYKSKLLLCCCCIIIGHLPPNFSGASNSESDRC